MTKIVLISSAVLFLVDALKSRPIRITYEEADLHICTSIKAFNALGATNVILGWYDGTANTGAASAWMALPLTPDQTNCAASFSNTGYASLGFKQSFKSVDLTDSSPLTLAMGQASTSQLYAITWVLEDMSTGCPDDERQYIVDSLNAAATGGTLKVVIDFPSMYFTTLAGGFCGDKGIMNSFSGITNLDSITIDYRYSTDSDFSTYSTLFVSQPGGDSTGAAYSEVAEQSNLQNELILSIGMAAHLEDAVYNKNFVDLAVLSISLCTAEGSLMYPAGITLYKWKKTDTFPKDFTSQCPLAGKPPIPGGGGGGDGGGDGGGGTASSTSTAAGDGGGGGGESTAAGGGGESTAAGGGESTPAGGGATTPKSGGTSSLLAVMSSVTVLLGVLTFMMTM